MQAALPKLAKRLAELKSLRVNELSEETGGGHTLDSLVQKFNATLREIFGVDTIEYDEYSVTTFKPEFLFFLLWNGHVDTR